MTKKKTHSDCRKLVCLLCFKRGKDWRPINDVYRERIETHVDLKGLTLDDERLPTVLCTRCRIILDGYGKDDSSKTISTFDYTELVSVKHITRLSTECTCYLCTLCRKKTCNAKKDKGGRPRTVNPKPTPIKLCSTCLSEVGQGKPHSCQSGQH